VLTATSLAAPRRPAPPGTVVRALVGDEDWAQALALRMALKDGAAEHRDFVERKQGAYREVCEAGRGAWFGAFVEGRMRAGAGVFSDGRGLARYQNVETHPGFRRRGLASSVVHAAGTWALRHFAAPTLVMAADPAYHAIHLYRTLGFTDTEPQVQLLRPTN
jgi:GNAT superfamily N-acetyltransferase